MMDLLLRDDGREYGGFAARYAGAAKASRAASAGPTAGGEA